MVKAIIAGQFRHIMGGAGYAFAGYLTAKGMSEGNMEYLDILISGLAVFLAQFASARDKVKQNKNKKQVERSKIND